MDIDNRLSKIAALALKASLDFCFTLAIDSGGEWQLKVKLGDDTTYQEALATEAITRLHTKVVKAVVCRFEAAEKEVQEAKARHAVIGNALRDFNLEFVEETEAIAAQLHAEAQTKFSPLTEEDLAPLGPRKWLCYGPGEHRNAAFKNTWIAFDKDGVLQSAQSSQKKLREDALQNEATINWFVESPDKA